MAYKAIYVDKRNEIIHLWDDQTGHGQYPLSTIQYCYRRSVRGEYTSLYGDKLERVPCEDYSSSPHLFESDVQPELKFLLDIYPDNEDVSEGHNILIIDIEVNTENGFPKIDEGDKEITAIALYDYTANVYHSMVLDPERKIASGTKKNVMTESFRDEASLLNHFLNTWESIAPTIVTGWNTSSNGGFDIPYIYHRLRRVLGKRSATRLSPIGQVYQSKRTRKMAIAGVNLLDYMDLYKKFVGQEKPSYALANVAIDEELKVKKITYKGSLNNLYKTDINRYVEYNLADVMVVYELDKKYDFINLCRSVCHKGHVPYEWFMMSSRWIDGAILSYLHQNGLIASNKPEGGREMYEEMEKDDEDGFEGAYVKEVKSGLYDWVYSADITSLYPSVIMSLNISSETKVGKIENWNRLSFDNGQTSSFVLNGESVSSADLKVKMDNYKISIGANGAVYSMEKNGIVPMILDKWFDERVEYRKLAKEYLSNGDKEKSDFYNRRQLRQKIFLNSVYGVLGLPIFRFYDKDNAECVTLSGQQIIKGAERIVNDYYHKRFKAAGINNDNEDYVIYVDTDSNYISSLPLAKLDNIPLEKMTEYTIELSKKVTDRINAFYQVMIPRIFNVPPEKNRIKIIPDVITKKALWLEKKRYCMLKVYDMEKGVPVKDKNGREGKIEFKGIDVVRSSFPKSFQKFASELLDDLLRDVPLSEIDEKIMKFEESHENKKIVDLMKTTSVKFISKDGEKNYAPENRGILQYILGSPVGVKSALAYNDLLKIMKLHGRAEFIEHGSKIKWIYLMPNEYFIETLGAKFDDTDPDQLLDFIEKYADRKKMYERELRSKIEKIYAAIHRPLPNRASQMANKTFKFEEEW